MSDETPTAYQVLARKYRPQTFADLIGQEAMVRTLKNAFAADRIAQAFMLTGIRGTGKTTTARIVAKGLNCAAGPTTDPCGTCEPCRAIAAGRHVDVLEMDAASNTRIDDIRAQVLDSVPYAPSSARYKVYIIDEVHMLSTSAFNALLKTLEEPPPHVKFIFATTEIRKVPVTVLSRCQRFDLRRIEPEDMIALMRRIATAEGGEIDDAALALIARASEGSARDATSLLDQALSRGGPVDAPALRAMLGLADRGRILDLFEMVLRGDAAGALREMSAQYSDGAEPLAILRDLAETCHWLSVGKITPEAAEDPAIAPDERDRGRTLAEAVPMRVLTRFWQMMLKALEEVAQAPNPMMAAEMALIRLTHVADLPPPEDLVRRLTEAGPAPAPAPAAPPAPQGGGPRARLAGGGAVTAPALAAYPAFDSVLTLIRTRRDMALLLEVEQGVRLVQYAPGRIEFEPAPGSAPDLAQRLGARLQMWTGARWGISVVAGGGAPSIAETRQTEASARETEARAHPLVQAVLTAFPGARITDIRPRAPDMAATEALPEVEDEWDPFEDD